ncbi:MAG TPA: amidohydrolase family protein [Terriglobia bacterium]|nr:amidohydrolase family protein [Terriglobia bacterium]
MKNLYASASLLLVSFLGVVLFSTRAGAQQPDPALLAKIDAIRAIDNHSHTPALTAPGEKDDDYDALPCEPLEPTEPTLTGLPDNPAFLEASKSLFGYPYNDRSPAHIKELLAAKARVRREQGDHYPEWVLDHLGIETELSNRIAMGRGLDPPRFRWVPFDDTLLFPLDNRRLANATPDRKIFFSRAGALLAAYLKVLGKSVPPDTLDEYLSEVVTPTLEGQRKAGAVAVKFEAAYLRPLDFEPAAKELAAQVYSRWVHAGAPPSADYTILQNYLFRYVAAEAGRLHMPVHIHTGFGCGSYFKLAGSNPLLLESVLDDPALRKTNFVLLHGGAGAYSKWVADLLVKPNVYTDMSEQTWLLPTRQVSRVVRDWLEWRPDKVMFGTDLSPGTPEIGWEEIGWQTTHSARRALAIALTGMMNDNEITRARAEQIARMVLRGNALKLYGWEDE